MANHSKTSRVSASSLPAFTATSSADEGVHDSMPGANELQYLFSSAWLISYSNHSPMSIHSAEFDTQGHKASIHASQLLLRYLPAQSPKQAKRAQS
eukprot:2601055-Amphidinium_carterae.1